MTPEQQDIVRRIRSSTEAIQRAVAAMPTDKQTMPIIESEWSVQEVLTHTLNADLLAFDLRIRRMLAEDDPLFPDYNDIEYRKANPAPMLPVDDLVQMITLEHELIVRLLSSLPESSWQRQGHHAVAGMRTVEYFARRVAEHAEEHAKQIADLRLQIAA